MGRLKFVDVPMPPKAFRLDGKRAKGEFALNFETEEKALKEDLRRAQSMREARPLFRRKMAKKAKRLKKRLLDNRVPHSLASSRFMRDVRLRVCGQLWRLIETSRIESARFFTVIPRDWEYAAGNLGDFCLKRALHSFRRNLNLYGANTAKGFFYAAVHGAFDPINQKYRLHLHGIASGEMVQVVCNLRRAQKLRSVKGDHVSEKVRQRVSVKRREIDNLPRTVSYTFKAFWPLRAGSEQANEPLSFARRGRLREPEHAEYLLWLDRYKPEDLVLTIGLSASRHGLKISKRRVQ